MADPNMKLRERYRRLSLWNKIAVWGSIASIVALLAALLPPIFHRETKGSLQIVDANLEEGQARFPVLDLKLRNTGPIAYIKQAKFTVEKIWVYHSLNCPKAVKASWVYDVLLPVAGYPKTVAAPVSQAIANGDVDRFKFILGNDAPAVDELNSYVFLLNVRLIYDEDSKEISTPPLAFISGPAQVVFAWTQCRDAIDVYPDNKRINLAFRDFKGIMSDQLRSVVSKYRNNLVPKLLGWLNEAGNHPAQIHYYIWSLYYIAPVEPEAVQSLRHLANNDPRQLVRSEAQSALMSLDTGKTFPKF